MSDNTADNSICLDRTWFKVAPQFSEVSSLHMVKMSAENSPMPEKYLKLPSNGSEKQPSSMFLRQYIKKFDPICVVVLRFFVRKIGQFPTKINREIQGTSSRC